jgi:hypothetical protein
VIRCQVGLLRDRSELPLADKEDGETDEADGE